MKTISCKSKESACKLAKTVEFLGVIAEENRLKALCFLRSGEKCVCEIWQFLNIPQNLASHHLKVLKDFGLVNDRKEGMKVFYSLNKKELLGFNLLLNRFLKTNGK
ncbi:MAG: metalloregulator ArsR/SmtB family transcription factor [bacterium]